jgi:hypothetical protein
VRTKLFRELSEDCWLLYADGHGKRASAIDFTVLDRLKPRRTPPRPTQRIDIEEWRTVWNRRLRPYLVPGAVRGLYAAAIEDEQSHRLGDFASVGIDYVSGDNNFFHLRPSEARRLIKPLPPHRRHHTSQQSGFSGDDWLHPACPLV